EKDHAPVRAQFHQQSPEKPFCNMQWTPPARQLVDLDPIDIFSVEAVAGAGVCGELRQQVVPFTAFADAVPHTAARIAAGIVRTCGGRSSGRHGTSIEQERVLRSVQPRRAAPAANRKWSFRMESRK